MPRREEIRELQRKVMPMGPFGSAQIQAMCGVLSGVAGTKHVKRLMQLRVEEDRETARYPNLPGLLEAEGAAAEQFLLRFGEPPVDGYSFVAPLIPSMSRKEPGVSAHSGNLTSEGNYLIRCGDVDQLGYLANIANQDRQAYLIRGRVKERRRSGEHILVADERLIFEPVPETAVIAIENSPSRALERWLSRRGVGLAEFVRRHS